MIDGELLQHVPGCENGDAPYSQELLGGGKVNRSFLVRTRRGRFVVRLNENSAADPGLDRAREVALHSAAAAAGIAPHIIYACPDHSCLITDYVEGRLWTPHYFTRMRDLRALGQRLRVLHALAAPSVAAVRSHGGRAPLCRRIVRSDPADASASAHCWRVATRHTATSRIGAARRLHRAQRPAPRQRAHRGSHLLHRLGIRAARRSAARPRVRAGVLPERGDAWRTAASTPRASASSAPTPAMLGELTRVFNLLTYLWYRARRLARNVPATDLQLESTALRRTARAGAGRLTSAH